MNPLKIIDVPTIQSQESDEEKELQVIHDEVEKQYRTTPKYERWVDLYLDKENKYGFNTYRNQTLSACVAYGYNRHDRKQYSIAGVIAHQNINKHKQLASRYYETMGITYGGMLELFFKMMIARKDVNMWYSLMDDLGYPVPKYINVTNSANFNR